MFIHTSRGRSLALTAVLLGSLIQLHAQAPKKTSPEEEDTKKPASASTTETTATLPEMVITATKTETERWRTASSVTVIDRKKIEEEQLRLVPDALREVPGLTIADRGTPGSVNGLFVRGTNSDHTLVVINGRPVPMNLAG
ncbi:MAG TPA: TonB-dependent receptor plug domain-containing protein, partial [Prosthecobacter sp.]